MVLGMALGESVLLMELGLALRVYVAPAYHINRGSCILYEKIYRRFWCLSCSDCVRRACDFLVIHRECDGGWGESFDVNHSSLSIYFWYLHCLVLYIRDVLLSWLWTACSNFVGIASAYCRQVS
jgi:hypothetical protein